MAKYIASQNIKNEEKRLSLINEIANPCMFSVLLQIKKDYPDILKIFDVGCGTGDAFLTFKKVFPEIEIVGIDQSEKALEVASQKNIAKKLIQVEITRMSENKEVKNEMPFDLVFIRNTLIHIQNPLFALEEMIKCARKNGIIFAQEANWRAADANWQDFKIFKKALMNMMSEALMYPYIGARLKEFFEQCGIKNIQERVFETIIKPEDRTWDILKFLLEVAGERILPFLKKEGVESLGEMQKRFDKARKDPKNYFRAPDWVIAYGEIL